MKKPGSRGFSLIEIMVAVVIISILAGIAVPSFAAQLRKARRADGITALMALQLAQEKYRADCPEYASTLGTPAAACDGKISVPTATPEGYYTISLSGSSSTAYTATATPVAGKSQANDSDCSPALSIAISAGAATYGPSARCWGR